MTAQIFSNSQLLELLEWHDIVNLIENHAHFNQTVSKRILLRRSSAEISQIQSTTQSFLEQYYSDAYNSARGALRFLNKEASFSELHKRLSKDAIGSLEELNESAKLMEFFFEERSGLSWAPQAQIQVSDLNTIKRKLFKGFVSDLRSFYDPDGSFDYLRHPRLASLYKKILDKESFLRRSVQAYMQKHSEKMQFTSHDVINDRFVVPLRADAYSANVGTIIARSESGNTLFIEPSELKQHNYQRLELLHTLDKEIYSLTIKYSQVVKEEVPFLQEVEELVFYLDEYFARADFVHINSFALPSVQNEFEINLQDFFHPLVEKCIRNSVEIGAQNRGLIISGANTGGKTVALKGMTIIALLSQYGLGVAASFAQLPLYDEIFYFGNDQQDLASGLSSFAGEVKNYNSMLAQIKGKVLIVIDEIFNSTSSEEASALAMALFEHIHKKAQAHIVVSTHHQMLKTFTHQQDDYICAHVGFDVESSQPTYKINMGSPGGSQALNIFRRLSSNPDETEDILNKAQSFLNEKMVNYESLLNKISAREDELEKLEQSNRTLNLELKNKKAAMEGVLELKLQEKLKNANQKIKAIFDDAEDLVKSIKSGNSVGRNTLINKEAFAKRELQKLQAKKESASQQAYSHLKMPKKLVPGEKYFSTQLKQTVTLKSVNERKKTVQVSKGIMSIECPIDSLRLSNMSSKEQHQAGASYYYSNRETKLEYDCRGMRLEEFEPVVENAVAHLIAGEIPYLTIIHGHGTGALKNWLRTYIKNRKEIKPMSTETGNDGETRIQLS